MMVQPRHCFSEVAYSALLQVLMSIEPGLSASESLLMGLFVILQALMVRPPTV